VRGDRGVLPASRLGVCYQVTMPLSRWSIAIALVTGCSASIGSPPPEAKAEELVACDPYQSTFVPTAWGKMLAAGRAADGTLFVADQTEYEPRLFISRRIGLVEAPAAVINTVLPKLPFYVQNPPWHTVEFDLASGSARAEPYADELGSVMGGDLAIIDAVQVSSMPAFEEIHHVTQVIAFAHVADDRVLTFIGPKGDDPPGAGWQIFFGPSGRIVEGSIVAASGGVTYESHVTFSVDGKAARADISAIQFESGTEWGPVSLVVGTERFENLDLHHWQSKPDEHSYLCRRR